MWIFEMLFLIGLVVEGGMLIGRAGELIREIRQIRLYLQTAQGEAAKAAISATAR
jgi:hypothetical protein